MRTWLKKLATLLCMGGLFVGAGGTLWWADMFEREATAQGVDLITYADCLIGLPQLLEQPLGKCGSMPYEPFLFWIGAGALAAGIVLVMLLRRFRAPAEPAPVARRAAPQPAPDAGRASIAAAMAAARGESGPVLPGHVGDQLADAFGGAFDPPPSVASPSASADAMARGDFSSPGAPRPGSRLPLVFGALALVVLGGAAAVYFFAAPASLGELTRLVSGEPSAPPPTVDQAAVNRAAERQREVDERARAQAEAEAATARAQQQRTEAEATAANARAEAQAAVARAQAAAEAARADAEQRLQAARELAANAAAAKAQRDEAARRAAEQQQQAAAAKAAEARAVADQRKTDAIARGRQQQADAEARLRQQPPPPPPPPRSARVEPPPPPVTAVEPVPPSAPPAVTAAEQRPTSPKAICAGKTNFVSRGICESRECRKPEFAQHADCVTYRSQNNQ